MDLLPNMEITATLELSLELVPYNTCSQFVRLAKFIPETRDIEKKKQRILCTATTNAYKWYNSVKGVKN